MARQLLKEHDPIITGIASSNKYVNYDRRFRMNYYAATALLARIELYRGNYTEACAYAEEVIACPTFRFIEEEEIIETDIYGKEQKIDRLFMPEMIFTLGNENILTVSQSDYESLGGDFVKSDACYESGDLRRNWLYTNPSANNKITSYATSAPRWPKIPTSTTSPPCRCSNWARCTSSPPKRH